MAIIVVEVMPKRELLDPAGKAVLGAFHRSGIDGFHEVRIGKRFELHVDGPATESHLADARKIADDLLSNGVIEDVLDVPSGGLPGMRVGVVTFPGSLDDRDALRAVRLAGGMPVPLWHGTHDLEGVDALILPGGFSYGDYLRCGAIAAHSPIMSEVVSEAKKGLPILGICNGFQILVEAGLLPGGLVRNDHGDFICRDQKLRVENTATAWTSGYEHHQEIVIPLKNGEGGFIADDESLKRIEGDNLVAFRYLEVNPNGSAHDIAGLRNESGRIVGLMPHPEHAVEAGFGPDTDVAMKSGTDGLAMFQSVLTQVVNA